MNYYWQYVAQHSHTVKFLTYFIYKNEEFYWDTEQKKIFVNLKAAFTKTMQLQIFQLKYDKKIEADASNFVIDDSLYQIEKDQWRSIVFWFWKLTESKERYKVHDKKLLIIVELLKKWRIYFESTTKSVKIYIDHKNLWNFATTKQLNQQQIHWAEQLADFEFEIHYKKNNENDSIDVLSWQSDYERVKITHKEIFRENSEKILTKNLVTTHHMKSVSQNDDDIIRKCHKTRVSEHLEIRRIKDLI